MLTLALALLAPLASPSLADAETICKVALPSAARSNAVRLDGTPYSARRIVCVGHFEDHGQGAAVVLEPTSDGLGWGLLSYWQTTDDAHSVWACVPNRLYNPDTGGYHDCPKESLLSIVAHR